MRLIDADATIKTYCKNSCMKGADNPTVPCAVPCEEVQAMLDAPTIPAPRWARCEEPPRSGQECFTAYRSILRSDPEWLYDICYYTDDLARDCPWMDGAEHRPGWYRYESEYGDVECHPKYWMPIEPPKEDA